MAAPYEHFSRIANKYSQLRTTDHAPLRFITKQLPARGKILAADIGCGSGRYDRLLLQYMRGRLDLICVDENVDMLRQLEQDLCDYAAQVRVVCARARCLPFATASLTTLFTFNAVHHFKVEAFFNEAARVLKPEGQLFIYTRTRSQNSRNIWGRYFPGFYEKETRLFELVELNNLLAATPDLRVKRLHLFQHRRRAELNRLLQQARQRHYSTFDLYTPAEFHTALAQFERNLRNEYPNSQRVTWSDENLMLVAEKSR